MNSASFFFPSFYMEVKTYEPKSVIKLIGENNWWKMVGTYGMIVLMLILLTLSQDDEWPLVLLFFLGFVIFLVFLNARGPSYLNQEIVFDEYGILLKHSNDLTGHRQIKPSEIQKIYIIILKKQNLKFILNDGEKPTFEFSAGRISDGKIKIFIQDVANLLGLNVENYHQFNKETVYELTNPALARNECVLPFEKKCQLTSLVIERVGSELIVSKLGRVLIDKKILTLSRREGMFTYENWHFGREQIPFRDIRKFEYEVSIVSHKHGKSVVGRFYVVTREKRARLLSVSMAVKHTQALLQFKMEEEMGQLKAILEAEI